MAKLHSGGSYLSWYLAFSVAFAVLWFGGLGLMLVQAPRHDEDGHREG